MDPIEIISAACPLCSRRDAVTLQTELEDIEDRVPGLYSISRCLSCHMVYLSLRPSEASLPACYPSNYHVVDGARAGLLAGLLYGLRSKLRCSTMLKAGGTEFHALLEVGCGDGSFLRYLDQRLPEACRLVGIDYLVSSPTGQSTRLTLVQGEIEKVEFPVSFDMVVMFNVLEHVADPLKVLARLSRSMSPGAVLFGEVPNWRSPWRRLFPRHWQGLQIPRHQTHFEPETLKKLFTQAGFVEVDLKPVYDPGDLAVTFCNWLSDTLGLETPPRKAWFYLPVVLISAPLVWLVNWCGGDSGSLGFTARKERSTA
jgi:SAM-dependent methyltransferase